MTIPAIEDVITTTVRLFLMSLFSDVAGFEAIKAQCNRVPMPVDNFAIITPLFTIRKSTTAQYYNAEESTVSIYEVQFMDVQIDIYGTKASDNAMRLETIFRSAYGYDLIKTFSEQIVPVTCNSVKQASITNGQKQWENRYIVIITIQVINPQTLPQNFFNQIDFKHEAQQ